MRYGAVIEVLGVKPVVQVSQAGSCLYCVIGLQATMNPGELAVAHTASV